MNTATGRGAAQQSAHSEPLGQRVRAPAHSAVPTLSVQALDLERVQKDALQPLAPVERDRRSRAGTLGHLGRHGLSTEN